MRIFTFEECIKYGFLTIEKLHQQFLDGLPIKKWHSEFNRFVNECVLPQILINKCNLLDSVDDSPYPYIFLTFIIPWMALALARDLGSIIMQAELVFTTPVPSIPYLVSILCLNEISLLEILKLY